MLTFWQQTTEAGRETIKAILPKSWQPKYPKPEKTESLVELKMIMEGKPVNTTKSLPPKTSRNTILRMDK